MSLKKIAVVVGTRPNFIKITQLEKEFNKYPQRFEFVLIHTGQHFDDKMSNVFFHQLRLKPAKYQLGIQGESREAKIELMIQKIGETFQKENPDLAIVVGDVDSTYAAGMAAKKLGIKLAHLESGLRSFDLKMPEEVNRIAVDKISDLFFVTEESGMQNLRNEKVEQEKVHFVGNTMIDTLVNFDEEIKKSPIINNLELEGKDYVLMTVHRPQNVDNKENLELILSLISSLSEFTQLVLPIHPRTLKQVNAFQFNHYIEGNKNLHLLEPLDYFAFQNLILNAKVVVTDSGGIQEETTFRKVPCLTIRNNTERPSTLELGTNELLALDKDLILSKVKAIYRGELKNGEVPPLWDGKATKRIVSVLNDLL